MLTVKLFLYLICFLEDADLQKVKGAASSETTQSFPYLNPYYFV